MYVEHDKNMVDKHLVVKEKCKIEKYIYKTASFTTF